MATLVCMPFRKLSGLKSYEHIVIALLNHNVLIVIWLRGMSTAVDGQRIQNQPCSRPKITPFFHGLVLVGHSIFLIIIITFLWRIPVILLTIWPHSEILCTLDKSTLIPSASLLENYSVLL